MIKHYPPTPRTMSVLQISPTCMHRRFKGIHSTNAWVTIDINRIIEKCKHIGDVIIPINLVTGDRKPIIKASSQYDARSCVTLFSWNVNIYFSILYHLLDYHFFTYRKLTQCKILHHIINRP